jgi:hypothetical protein
MRAGNGNEMHVNVSFGGRGFVATAPELHEGPVVALSLAGLRRRIESLMVPDHVDVRMHLDRHALRERDARRWGGTGTRDRPDRPRHPTG